jgi:hypothetical protein
MAVAVFSRTSVFNERTSSFDQARAFLVFFAITRSFLSVSHFAARSLRLLLPAFAATAYGFPSNKT